MLPLDDLTIRRPFPNIAWIKQQRTRSLAKDASLNANPSLHQSATQAE
jgi:hypothetical protein